MIKFLFFLLSLSRDLLEYTNSCKCQMRTYTLNHTNISGILKIN